MPIEEGLEAAGARAKLEEKMLELDREKLLVRRQLDRERLLDITNDLVRTITSPQVIENMRKFREQAKDGAKFADAADLMSLESLRAAGAKIPEGFRLSSRVFEDLESGLRLEILPPKRGGLGDPLDPLAWGACAGGGAATVCGCAGGSS